MTLPDNATNGAQPQPPVGQPQGTEGTTPPSSVSREEVANMLKEFQTGLTSEMSKWYKGMQKQNQSIQDKVAEQVSRVENLAKEAGIELTAADKQALQTNSLAKVLENEQLPGTNVPGQAPLSEDELVKSTNAASTALQQAYGIMLDDSDPEADIVAKAIEAGATPKEYLKSIMQAIETKAARLEKQKPAAPTSPGAVQGKGGSNPLEGVLDRDALWKAVQKAGEV